MATATSDRTSLVFRPIRPKDRAALVQLWSRCWLDGHGPLVPRHVIETRVPAYFDKFVDPHLEGFHGAYVGTELAGLGLLVDNTVDQIHVAAAHRGTGLASRLIGYLEDRIAADGHRTVLLFCAVGNERGRRFYLRHGYRAVAREYNDLWVPAGTPPVTLAFDAYEKPLDDRARNAPHGGTRSGRRPTRIPG